VACMQLNQEAREAYWGVYPTENGVASRMATVRNDDDE
jgi:hypothetical protein